MMTWNLYYFWKAHFKLKFPLVRSRDRVNGASCVQGGNQRVDLLEDGNVRFTGVFSKVTKG